MTEGLRSAIREVLVAWERYFDSENDAARRTYWGPLARAMDELNAQGFETPLPFRSTAMPPWAYAAIRPVTDPLRLHRQTRDDAITEPTTEAGKRLLRGLPSQGTGLVALNAEALSEAVADIEAEAATAERERITPPLGTRLILVAGDLLQWIGTRTESGDLLTAEWGEKDERGWYEPFLTSHHDDNLVAAERERIKAAVEGLFDSPAVYPGSMAATIRAENDLVRAVLRIIEGADANA